MEGATFPKELRDTYVRLVEPFYDEMAKESDRAMAILAACLIDQLLERVIGLSYVKDKQVKSLFKDDHMLQSFSSKINIAYFSGLLPNVIYHDLKLVCQIRNKFAHAVVADLRFTHKAIAQIIDRFELGPMLAEIPDELPKHRTKFLLVVAQVSSILRFTLQLLSQRRPPHLVEVLKLNEMPWEESALTQAELRNLLRKGSTSSKAVS